MPTSSSRAERPRPASKRAAHLRGLGGRAVGVPVHAGSLDDLDVLVERTVAEFGGIDVVVNNAANALAQPLGEMTADALAKSSEVNLRGPIFLVQKALPHLKASPAAAVLKHGVGRGVQLRGGYVDLRGGQGGADVITRDRWLRRSSAMAIRGQRDRAGAR